jgi:RHS repeat-associated protein
MLLAVAVMGIGTTLAGDDNVPVASAAVPAQPANVGSPKSVNARPLDDKSSAPQLSTVAPRPATSQVLTTTTTVIRYTYDPLQRLTSATYSDGKSFQYEYDAVGNRTVSTQTITSTLVTSYTYDVANRLTNVNGQAYTWDANGNLLSDGSKMYLYNSANQLITITATGLAWSAAYNGDGARLKQTVNGSVMTYTLDLNAGLVQVLAHQDVSGMTRYLHGVTRIGEQQPGGWAYHLSDALGSVRQLVDGSAQVTLARGYMPYGEPLWSVGSGSSAYGYTGEDWNTMTQLVFLRARYMQPGLGAFLTEDTEPSNTMQPSDGGGYLYANENPVNNTDPSGLCVFCDSGDRVKVDARPDGVIFVYEQPDQNSRRIARLTDNSVVRVSNASRGRGLDGWRRVVTGRFQTGWVLNVRLLDNCDGPPGTFACLPIAGWAPQHGGDQGFGATRIAYRYCAAGLETAACIQTYRRLRGLHNGLDFTAQEGSPLIWPGTSEGRVTTDNRDAMPNIVVDYDDMGRRVIFGHRGDRYVWPDRGILSTVRPGQTIGESGSSNGYPHLHFGVRYPSGASYVHFNPLYYLTVELRGKIIGEMAPYAMGYHQSPYSMISFDSTKGGSFWDSPPCCSYAGITFATEPGIGCGRR